MRLRTESMSVAEALDGSSANFRTLVEAICDDLTDLATMANTLNQRSKEISSFLVRETSLLFRKTEELEGSNLGYYRSAPGERSMNDHLGTRTNLSFPGGTVVWDPRYGCLLPAHERETKVQLLQYPESFVKKYIDLCYYDATTPQVRLGSVQSLYPMLDGREDTWALLPGVPGEQGEFVLEVTLPQQLVSNLTLNSIGLIFHPAGTLHGISYVDANTGEELDLGYSLVPGDQNRKKIRYCFDPINASVLKLTLSMPTMLDAAGRAVVPGIQSLDLDLLHPSIQDPPRFTYKLDPKQQYPELADRTITAVSQVFAQTTGSTESLPIEYRLWKDEALTQGGVGETTTWIEILPQKGLDDIWEINRLSIQYTLA